MMTRLICTVIAISVLYATGAFARPAADIYRMICTPCHGAKGEGKPGVAPPLRDSEFIRNSTDEEVKDTIKNGRQGLAKRFLDYPGPMPPRKAMSDEDLNGLVKYLREVIVK